MERILLQQVLLETMEKKYDLKKDLRLAQLRKLAKCVSVKGHNSLSKAMVCR
jgi:hypothetical protein